MAGIYDQENGDYGFALMLSLNGSGSLSGRKLLELSSILDEHIHGTCPKCGFSYKGKAIWVIAMMQKSFMPVGEQDMMKRVMNGICPFAKCDAEEIILEWQP